MADEKKITDEILNDEELEQVAGGNYFESMSDAQKFENLGIKISEKNIGGMPILMHDEFVKLRETFKIYGVEIKDHGGLINDNEYFINGNQVSRDDAWKHIESQFKK